jgi:hypothetical protein
MALITPAPYVFPPWLQRKPVQEQLLMMDALHQITGVHDLSPSNTLKNDLCRLLPASWQGRFAVLAADEGMSVSNFLEILLQQTRGAPLPPGPLPAAPPASLAPLTPIAAPLFHSPTSHDLRAMAMQPDPVPQPPEQQPSTPLPLWLPMPIPAGTAAPPSAPLSIISWPTDSPDRPCWSPITSPDSSPNSSQDLLANPLSKPHQPTATHSCLATGC